MSGPHQLSRSQPRSFFLNQLPGSLDVALCRIRLSYTNPQRQPIIEARMRQIEVTAAIETVHQGLIDLVSPLVPKADKVQGHRRSDLKAIVIPHPRRKLMRQSNVLPNVMLQSLHTVVPDDEP